MRRAVRTKNEMTMRRHSISSSMQHCSSSTICPRKGMEHCFLDGNGGIRVHDREETIHHGRINQADGGNNCRNDTNQEVEELQTVDMSDQEPWGGNSQQTNAQNDGCSIRSTARMASGSGPAPEGNLSGKEKDDDVAKRGQLVPTAAAAPAGILEVVVYEGGTTNTDEIEELESLWSSRHIASCSWLLPTTPGYRKAPYYISAGAEDDDNKNGHSHLVVTREDIGLKDDDDLKDKLALMMRPKNDHCHPASQSPTWVEFQEETSRTTDSFLSPDELSSLSDDDHEEQGSHSQKNSADKVAEEQEVTRPTRNSPPQHEQAEIECNMHKALTASAMFASSSVACMSIKKEDAGMLLSSAVGDNCNDDHAPPGIMHQQSTFLFHHTDTPILLQHYSGRQRISDKDQEDTFAGDLSPLTLISSMSSLFGSSSLAPATPKKPLHKPQSIAAHNQEQQNERNTGDTKDEVDHWNINVSLDVQPKEGGPRHHRRCGRRLLPSPTSPSPLPLAPVLVGGESTSEQQPLLAGSSNNTDLKSRTKATKNDAALSFGGRKVMMGMQDDEDRHGGVSDGEEEQQVVRIHDRPTQEARISCRNTIGMSQNRKNDDDSKKNDVPNIDQWYMRYQELVEYKIKHGHCNVPFVRRCNNDDEDDHSSRLLLAAWVKRQRYQYKCKVRGKHSHLTDERESLLEELGFVWDTHVAAWEENFALMAEFHKQHGHCCIPIKHRVLSAWTKRQRRNYKQNLLEQGAKNKSSATTNAPSTTSKMSEDRIRRLNEINFQWAPTTTIMQHAREEDEEQEHHDAIRSKKRMRLRSSTTTHHHRAG